ncbi:MAG: hypothetical protein DRP29_00335 [Thermodesulfobacteriota bacterium]|nr:MAG: hypothetical protein DRP29_00335 [Thermodesulfobacteriota bacterium]
MDCREWVNEILNWIKKLEKFKDQLYEITELGIGSIEENLIEKAKEKIEDLQELLTELGTSLFERACEKIMEGEDDC